MTPDEKDHIVAILDDTDEMSLATQREDGFPQATIVAFVNDGLTLWFGTSPDSQKANNLAADNRVSATVTPPYDSWETITGVSLGGHCTLVDDPQEREKVGKQLLTKFPDISDYGPPVVDESTATLAMYRVDPMVVTLIDYDQGFGHSEQFDL